jgi:hypothetical protein
MQSTFEYFFCTENSKKDNHYGLDEKTMGFIKNHNGLDKKTLGFVKNHYGLDKKTMVFI